MHKHPILLAIILLLMMIAGAACNTTPTEPTIDVIAEGLIGPIGLARLPDGTLLVAEAGTGQRDNSGGISIIKPDGTTGRLISGLPSDLDAGDLAGTNLVAVSPAADKIYIGTFGQEQLLTLPLSTIEQDSGLKIPETPLTPGLLWPDMTRLNNVYLVNPFDMAFTAGGKPVVSDASGNGVAVRNADGTTRFIHRFDRLPNPVTPNKNDNIDAVPTGITRVGNKFYVTLFGGCPYPDGSGRLVAIDGERNEEIVLDGLTLPIDVAQGPNGDIWLLEFARFTPDESCFSGQGYQPNSGRLSRLNSDGALAPVLTNLNYPGAVLPAPDGTLFISEVFTGRVIRVTLPPES